MSYVAEGTGFWGLNKVECFPVLSFKVGEDVCAWGAGGVQGRCNEGADVCIRVWGANEVQPHAFLSAALVG